MAWLMSDAHVLASVDVATSRASRAKGLLGRDTFEGAFAIPKCRWVHTMGMRFALDIAYVGADDQVIKIATMRPYRFACPVPKARTVIEARAGSFERWGLRVGDPVELRLTDPNCVL